MFSGKRLHSHSASLHPGVQIVPTNLMLMGWRQGGEGNPAMDSHPVQEGREIFLVTLGQALSFRPLGLYADLTFLPTFNNWGLHASCSDK